MASDGFGFFYNKLGLSIDDLAFYYNFTNSGASVEVVSGDSSLSGIIDTEPAFWANYGSGQFKSGGVTVANYHTLQDEDWSLLLLPDKRGLRSETLFSTMDTGMSSGLVVSFNDVNDIVIITKDSNGYLYSDSFNLPLSNKNILGFTKAGNTISCFSYDPSNFEYNTDSKAFPSSCLLNNFSGLELGKTKTNLTQPFSGFLDEAALIKTVLNGRQFQVLSSGFIRSGYTYDTVIETGFVFGTAHCNGSGYISGFDPSLVYTTVEVPSAIDYEFLKTLKKSGIKYTDCSANSHFYAVGFLSNPEIHANEDIFFDLVNGYFRSSDSRNFGDTLFYYSGQLMNKVSDYTYSSNLLIKSGSNYLAEGVLDALGHSYNITSFTTGDLASGESFATFNGNSIIFLNGDCLISGVDYNTVGSDFVSISNTFSGASGTLIEIVFDDPIFTKYTTGKFIQAEFYDDDILPFIDRRRRPLSKFRQLSSVELSYASGLVPCFSGDLIYGNEGTYIDE